MKVQCSRIQKSEISRVAMKTVLFFVGWFSFDGSMYLSSGSVKIVFLDVTILLKEIIKYTMNIILELVVHSSN